MCAQRAPGIERQRLIDGFLRSALGPTGRAALERVGLQPLDPAEAQRELARLDFSSR